ncbi:RelA/SpoT domain-containing protein [Enterovirga sp. CN4-39]|uniref:RelA/SpoT domain-containing protein n=1 Tax=Enterovirga sp. CN4-39 TaxID=3400910 RepID=UPI003C0E9BED
MRAFRSGTNDHAGDSPKAPVSDDDMGDFPQLEFSIDQVKRAGELLREDLIWSADREPEIREVFRIANNWRESHALPMHRIRQFMTSRLRSASCTGLTAARLKRMSSVRKKLRTQPTKLHRMQDLGGCRAILTSMDEVRRLLPTLRESERYRVYRETDYISSPKPDGYRCHHLMVEFRGEGSLAPFDGRRIELQVRSRLQHSWATAVEAVGLYRSEDFKGGSGDPQWRRLFALMSAELASVERCPEPADVGDAASRAAELRELNERLDAVEVLERLRQTIRYAKTYLDPLVRPDYFLVRFDPATRLVTIDYKYGAKVGTSSLNEAELRDEVGSVQSDTVLIEADRLEQLEQAYPNYFGDVHIFAQNLSDIARGKGAREYTLPPRSAPPPPPYEAPDASWFRRVTRR